MFSNKTNVLQLLALLKGEGIQHIVVCPGSRNSPLVHSFAYDKWFTCYSITDERSAGFFALGLMMHLQQPVAVCCTSGSAVLNLAPSVAEAWYQQLPLLVISADRPDAWIGQMDGQTISQSGAYRSMVKKAIQLPEPVTDEELWHCNRLINEALIALNQHGKGPVQINIPLSEPLFQYNTESLPEVRRINYHAALSGISRYAMEQIAGKFRQYNKILLIIGQLLPDAEFAELIKNVQQKYNCLVFAEQISNMPVEYSGKDWDAFLYKLSEDEKQLLRPELVITMGGHIVSKRLKQFLRSYSPEDHWHITQNGEVADLFKCMTGLIEADPKMILQGLYDAEVSDYKNDYGKKWFDQLSLITAPQVPYSDLYAAGALCGSLPEGSVVHLANSSSIRHAAHFALPENTWVYANRGTSGIEGSLSTTVGYAAISGRSTFLLTGDLSFFYDMNGLWNRYITPRLRILLNNNGGGGIFYALPGLNRSEAISPYIAACHNSSAKVWAEVCGFDYLAAHDQEELDKQIIRFTQQETDKPILLEVFTDMKNNTEVLRNYYHQL